jgi:hypothetical protein
LMAAALSINGLSVLESGSGNGVTDRAVSGAHGSDLHIYRASRRGFCGRSEADRRS